MSHNFEVQLVNGIDGDPAVVLSFAQFGESVLFDAGSLENLSNRELLKIRVVAISHTHVDHFIGFDRLLRVNIPHFRTLEIVGPTGIISNVRGKIAGYTWNLLQPDQVNFVVHEISKSGEVTSVSISNTNNFSPVNLNILTQSHGTEGIAEIPLQSFNQRKSFKLTAAVLEHGTDVLAYYLKMPDVSSVKKETLGQLSLQPGPWIKELQGKVNQGALDGDLSIQGVTYPIQYLASSIFELRSGHSLVYVTDIIFSPNNVNRLSQLVDSPPEIVVAEANFRHCDRDKARAKSHLTTTQAAIIAAKLRSKKLKIFHISSSYGGDNEPSLSESRDAFKKYSEMSPDELTKAVSQEFPV